MEQKEDHEKQRVSEGESEVESGSEKESQQWIQKKDVNDKGGVVKGGKYVTQKTVPVTQKKDVNNHKRQSPGISKYKAASVVTKTAISSTAPSPSPSPSPSRSSSLLETLAPPLLSSLPIMLSDTSASVRSAAMIAAGHVSRVSSSASVQKYAKALCDRYMKDGEERGEERMTSAQALKCLCTLGKGEVCVCVCPSLMCTQTHPRTDIHTHIHMHSDTLRFIELPLHFLLSLSLSMSVSLSFSLSLFLCLFVFISLLIHICGHLGMPERRKGSTPTMSNFRTMQTCRAQSQSMFGPKR